MKRMIPIALAAVLLASCGDAAADITTADIRENTVSDDGSYTDYKDLKDKLIGENAEKADATSGISAGTSRHYDLYPTKECFDSLTYDDILWLASYRIKTGKTDHEKVYNEFIDDLYTMPALSYVRIAPDSVLTDEDLREWAVGKDNMEYSIQTLKIDYEDDVCIVLYDPYAYEPSEKDKNKTEMAKYGGRIVVPKNVRLTEDNRLLYTGEHTADAVRDTLDLIVYKASPSLFDGDIHSGYISKALAREVTVDEKTGLITYDLLATRTDIARPFAGNIVHHLLLGSIKVSEDFSEVSFDTAEEKAVTNQRNLTLK